MKNQMAWALAVLVGLHSHVRAEVARPAAAAVSAQRSADLRIPFSVGGSLAAPVWMVSMPQAIPGARLAAPKSRAGLPGVQRARLFTGVDTLPDVRPGRIYEAVRSDAGFFMTLLDWRRRRVLWRVRTKEGVGPVALSNGVLVCAGISAGGVTAAPLQGLDARTGRRRWKQPDRLWDTDGMVGITVSRGLIVVVSPMRIYCLRASTGKTIWTRTLIGGGGRQWPHSPVISGDTVYTQFNGTLVVARSLRNGRLRWQHSFPWVVSFEAGNSTHRVGPTAVTSGRVLGIVPTGPQETTSPALMCWEARSGKLLWRQSVPWTNDPLVIVSGVVCLIGNDNIIHGYLLQSGQSVWQRANGESGLYGPWRSFGGEIIAAMYSNDRIFLACLNATRGELTWRVPLPDIHVVDRIDRAPDGAILATGTKIRGGAWPDCWLYRIRVPIGGPPR
jgi:outer membrane protein assembly factor BamB